MSNPFADLRPIAHDGRTYDEWFADGYVVRRGEQATGRNPDGVPTFTADQVVEQGDFSHLND